MRVNKGRSAARQSPLVSSLPRACAVLTACIGAIVIAGWFFSVPLMQSFVPGFVSMKPNTALCFILSGSALYLLTARARGRSKEWVARACALLVLLLSMAVLGEFLFGWQIGVDEFLFSDPMDTPRTFSPGRMALSTVIAFVLVGLSLLSLRWEPRLHFRPADGCAFAVFLLACCSVVQSLLTSESFDQYLGLTPMALHTSLGFVLLSLGILIAQPDQGLTGFLVSGVSESLERRIYASIITSILLFAVASLVALFSAYDSLGRSQLVNQTHRTQQQLLRISNMIRSMESGIRGYVLTGTNPFLEPFELALSETEGQLNTLEALVANHPSQRENASLLRVNLNSTLDYAQQLVSVRKARGGQAARELVATGEGKARLDALAGVLSRMEAEEERLLQLYVGEERKGASRLASAIAIGAAFALTIMLSLAAIIRRGFTLSHHAETLLRASEEDLAITLRSIGDAVLTTDTEGAVVRLNPVAEHLTGWRESQAKGRPVNEVFHIINEESREPADVPVKRVLETGLVQGLANHTVLVARNGTETAIADSAAPVCGEDGELRGVVLVFRDATAERRAEEAIRQREELLRCVLDSIDANIAVLDNEGVIIMVNQAWETFAQGACADPEIHALGVGTNYLDACGTAQRDDAPKMYSGIEAVLLQTRSDFSMEYGCNSRMGHRWFLLHVCPLNREGGGAVVTHMDTTERKLVTQRLDEFKAALDEHALVAITDAGGKITYANDLFCLVSGYSREELLGQDHQIINSGFHPPGFFRNMWETISGGRVWKGEVRNRAKSGRHFWEATTIVPFLDTQGKPTQYIAIRTDISERKETETELERARAAADSANRAKSTFLATMSHEIRTPMNGVIGTVDVLRQTSLRPYQVELVEIIRESAYSLLGVIDDILDFSKIEAGKIEIQSEPVSLEQTVETVCDVLNPVAVRKQVDLSYFTDPRLPEVVLTDSLRLRQILNNLLGNAIKFSVSPARPGRVKVRMEWAAPALARITVVDNGVGMSQEVLARLFTPFTQADSSTTRSYGGTGLGLSICKQLVTLLGGVITVESALGFGSTFRVTIPAEEGSGLGAGLHNYDLVGLRCIVVSPDVETAADWSIYLKHAGASVETVEDLPCSAAVMAREAEATETVVISTSIVPFNLCGLRAHYTECPQKPRFVLVTRGYHRRPHQEAPDVVVVDGDAMRRGTFLHAVALVVGRAEPVPEEEWEKLPGRLLPPSIEEAAAQGRLILVAEDNEINQKVIRHQLAVLGFACEIADNGTDALACWRKRQHALLLSDLHMPGLDGHQLAAAIRAEENGNGRMPIIAFTANITKGERERCELAGMDDYLSKPVQLEVFRAMLDKWLNTSQEAGDNRSARTVVAVGRPADSFPILDVTILQRLIGDDPELITEFLSDFVKSSDTAAQEIRTAYTAGNLKDIGSVAHRLKSAARSVGALALGERCAAIERAGGREMENEISALIPEFEKELAAALAAIELKRTSRG